MANEEQIEDQGSDMEDAFSPSDFQSITKLLIQLSKLQHFLTRRNKQNQMPVNPYMNSLYYLHPGENPGALIVNVTLNPSNYHAWLRAMRLTLRSKNKFEFVDSSLPKPDKNHLNYLA
ncbi:uncharacterized protein DS421_12g374080 [Arachis hypogaea]|nr:uncharacterized protein DS421_12g374080 [Arachis hypogaea]